MGAAAASPSTVCSLCLSQAVNTPPSRPVMPAFNRQLAVCCPMRSAAAVVTAASKPLLQLPQLRAPCAGLKTDSVEAGQALLSTPSIPWRSCSIDCKHRCAAMQRGSPWTLSSTLRPLAQRKLSERAQLPFSLSQAGGLRQFPHY